MADESKFKLRVYIDKLLDEVMIVAERQHLVYQELKREVT